MSTSGLRDDRMDTALVALANDWPVEQIQIRDRGREPGRPMITPRAWLRLAGAQHPRRLGQGRQSRRRTRRRIDGVELDEQAVRLNVLP